MRRPAADENDDYDEKDNVTIKSMLISMVRVCNLFSLAFSRTNVHSHTLITQMPSRLWKLMICQVIGWIGYFATHLYYTDFIATVCTIILTDLNC